MKIHFANPRAAALLSAAIIALALPPSASPAGIPSADAAAGDRAMNHVRQLAAEPHPMGSAAHDRAGHYILSELKGMGVDSEARAVISRVKGKSGEWTIGSARNIVGRLAGQPGGRTVIFMAHYDSVVASNGAGDNAASVAGLLETIRTLASAPPRRNELVFVFTDGEEQNLLGARALLEEAWARDAAAVINFDSRGTEGRSFLFETGPDSGWLVREYLQARPQAGDTSFGPAFFKHMAHGTDLAPFKRAGIPGLSFGFFEGAANYHTAADRVEHLSAASVAEQGAIALAIGRRLGGIDLNKRSHAGSVYFRLPLVGGISYSALTARLLAVGLLIVLAALVWRKRKQGGLNLADLAKAAGVAALGQVAVAGLAFLYLRYLTAGVPAYAFLAGPLSFAAAALMATAVSGFLCLRWPRGASAASRVAGAACWWAVLSVTVAWLEPGASFAIALPALVGVSQLALLQPSRPFGLRSAAVLLATGMAAAVVSPLVIAALFAAPSQLPFTIAFVGLAVFLIVPYWAAIGRVSPAAVRIGALAAVAVAAGAAVMAGPVRPLQVNQMSYLMHNDGDRSSALWASTDRVRDPWTVQFLDAKSTAPRIYEYVPEWYSGALFRPEALRNQAPVLALGGPRVIVAETQAVDGRQRIVLQAESTRSAPEIALRLTSDGGFTRAELNGVVLFASTEKPERDLKIRFYRAGKDGLRLSVDVGKTASVRVEAIDRSYELPTVTSAHVNPRASSMMPLPGVGDATIVASSFVF